MISILDAEKHTEMASRVLDRLLDHIDKQARHICTRDTAKCGRFIGDIHRYGNRLRKELNKAGETGNYRELEHLLDRCRGKEREPIANQKNPSENS